MQGQQDADAWQIKAKLAKEGLFDSELKRPLPYFPKRVGVVTSPNGAAFHDILNVLGRRTKTVHITLIPTRVQGETAGEEIEKAIRLANKFNEISDEKIDVLIVGRGGGSAEDLWAFNEERVARAIRNSKIPIISAVGHEIDWTIADFTADVRAATPSAAAEIVAENEENLENFLFQRTNDLFQLVNYKILQARNSLQELAYSSVFHEFPNQIKDWKYEIEDFQDRMETVFEDKLRQNEKRLELLRNRLSPIKLAAKVSENQTLLALLKQRQLSAIKDVIDAQDEKLKIKMASLDALSPLSVLKRGYSIVESENGKILHDIDQVKIDENVQIRLANGKLKAKILEKK